MAVSFVRVVLGARARALAPTPSRVRPCTCSCTHAVSPAPRGICYVSKQASYVYTVVVWMRDRTVVSLGASFDYAFDEVISTLTSATDAS